MRRTGTWSPSPPPTHWLVCSTSSSTSSTKVPCLEALATAPVVSAPDLSRETRWNGYPARALAHGVRAVYSSPLLVNDRPIGALNLYATTADPFDAAAQETAAQLTALAAATITAAMRHYNEATLTDHLRSSVQPVGDRPGHRHRHGHRALQLGRSLQHPAHRLPTPQPPHPPGRHRPRREDQRQHHQLCLTARDTIGANPRRRLPPVRMTIRFVH